ncbi:cell division protein FtsL [Rhizobium leguminosarum]
MLKTFDLVLIGVMTATAAVTYTIKHRAELKLEEVHRLEAEIKLEKDTIDLLKADWALQSQPNRLERLVKAYNDELKLQPTESTALVHAKELPMLKSEVPVPDVTEAKASAKGATVASAKSATVASAKGAPDTAKGAQATAKAQPIPMSAPRGEAEDADQIETGSVEE